MVSSVEGEAEELPAAGRVFCLNFLQPSEVHIPSKNNEPVGGSFDVLDLIKIRIMYTYFWNSNNYISNKTTNDKFIRFQKISKHMYLSFVVLFNVVVLEFQK